MRGLFPDASPRCRRIARAKRKRAEWVVVETLDRAVWQPARVEENLRALRMDVVLLTESNNESFFRDAAELHEAREGLDRLIGRMEKALGKLAAKAAVTTLLNRRLRGPCCRAARDGRRSGAILDIGCGMGQGCSPMKRILFLCSRNKLRSPTAEAIFSGYPGVEVDSAGLNPDAEVPVSAEQIEWADLIVVMEKIHRTRLNRQFSRFLSGKKVAVLDIPDRYDFMEPALVSLLKARCAPYLR